ncbi:hypothetical protein QLQ12_35985 [Actinoplanes sp. NEAU-A12]|uniref:ANTAR domain-containing protein n=1 Tax=Actinoplanes sandaracinus TaxID=3045177 RepID=A0ABT6WW86_9ACTN|nr:hypothetical protein [Actinoplanes sandaracinus]MDI6104004.1 hypothetical protein [Actinoplanes sandaracinus]
MDDITGRLRQLDDMRPAVRAAAAGGDAVDVARLLHAHGPRGVIVHTARPLREELDLTITQALDLASWAEVPEDDDEQSRASLRSGMPTPLRARHGVAEEGS